MLGLDDRQRLCQFVFIICLIIGMIGGGHATPTSWNRAGVPSAAVQANPIVSVDEPLPLVHSLQEEEEEEGEDKTGPRVLPDWWGLGGEAQETPYIGLVELGVTLLVIGVGGYIAGKRLGIVPPRYRHRLLQAHEWTVLIGTGLTIPHFLFAEEWEGLGFLVGLLLAVEVISGSYGRHLHRYVVRLGRDSETSAYFAEILNISNRVLFRRWRKIHISLTSITALVLLLHILTAIGD